MGMIIFGYLIQVMSDQLLHSDHFICASVRSE